VPYRRLGTLYLDNQTIQVTNTRTNYRATAHDFFKDRSEDPKLVVTTTLADPQETDNAPYANLNPITGSPLPSGPVASPLTFYLHDHLGNTRVLFRADAPGAYAIDYAADYLPFGNILREYPGCNRDRFLSTHHERDAATGYDNRGARMYDGEIGRFFGVDPLAGHPNQVMMSRYRYAWGDPVSLTDPDGKCPWCWGAVAGAVTDYGLQVVGNFMEGKTGVEAFTDIDMKSIGTSTLAGAASGGLSMISKLKKAKKIYQLGAEALVDGTGSAVNQYATTGEVSMTEAVLDGAGGALVGRVAGPAGEKFIKSTPAGKAKAKKLQTQVRRTGNRAENRAEIAANGGRSRPAQAAAAGQARNAATAQGAGAGAGAGVAGSGVTSGAIDVKTPVEKDDDGN
jgi:RHS repeat-associated protein